MLPSAYSRRWLAFFLLSALLFFVGTSGRAASLQTFAVVFGQATNELAMLQAGFDGSPAQKQQIATLVRVRSVILNPDLRDDRALAAIVELLGNNSSYESTLNESAANARAAVLGHYNSLANRVAELPPSTRATRARTRFEALASDLTALNHAQSAADISAQLAPFGTRVAAVSALVELAQTMPRPAVGANAVRARINGTRFASAGSGGSSPNIIQITAPEPLYREVVCRFVDGARVLQFTLPVVTEQVRYDLGQNLAAVTFTPDVFAPGAVPVSATEGTFFVQSNGREIYGMFTASGPAFEVQDGRFRVTLPRVLRD